MEHKDPHTGVPTEPYKEPQPSMFEQIVTFLKGNAEIMAKWTIEQKREIEALYKQATIGDVNIPEPGPYDIEARDRWNAWKAKAGTTKDKAMQMYVDMVNTIMPGKFTK